MVNYTGAASRRLDRVFSALADPTRRAIVTRLARGEAQVSELAEPFNMTLPAVSKHLKVLERAGLLAREVDGRVHRCRLDANAMDEAVTWIERRRAFWNRQLDSLAVFLARSESASRPRRKGGTSRSRAANHEGHP